jgi:hypothetical protein
MFWKVVMNRVHMNMCLILNGCTEIELFESANTKMLQMVMKGKLITLNFILIFI